MSHRTVPDELLLELEDPPDEPLLLELEDPPPDELLPLELEDPPPELEEVAPLEVDVVVPLDVEVVPSPDVEELVPPLDVDPPLEVEDVVPLEVLVPLDVLVAPLEVEVDPEDVPLEVVPPAEEPELELPERALVDRSDAVVSNDFSRDSPSRVRPTMRTTATAEAISAYSIEVVPPSEARNGFHDMSCSRFVDPYQAQEIVKNC